MKKLVTLLLLSGAISTSAFGDLVCAKVTAKLRNDKVKPKLTTQTVQGSSCPKGFTAIVDTSALATAVQGPQGIPGNDGVPGADGSLRIYGDGSAGAFVHASGTQFNEENLQFTDFTVNAGTTLNLPSGTVIRCSGTFTNNGTIQVARFAGGGRSNMEGVVATIATVDGVSPAHPGIGIESAATPEFGDSSSPRTGGSGVSGYSTTGSMAGLRSLLLPGPIGGGGGAGRRNGNGAQGGGTLVVLCDQGIVNNGSIQANGGTAGAAGGGGGGGGLVIFASRSSITNTSAGAISANGGKGGDANNGVGATCAAAGGGGGGLIHLLAPVVTVSDPSDLTVSGGQPGIAANITSNPRSGGAGGGGSVGSGGQGATVETTGDTTTTPATAGGVGQVLIDLIDPTALF